MFVFLVLFLSKICLCFCQCKIGSFTFENNEHWMQNKYFNVTCQRGRILVLNCVTNRGTVLPVGTLPFIEDGIKYTCDPVEDSLDPDYPENPFEGSGETEIVGDCENGNLEYEFQGFLVSCISNKILGCVNPKGQLIREGYFVVKDKLLKFCKVYANGRKARIENRGCFNGSSIDSPADEIYHVPKYTIWTEGRLQLRCGDSGIQVYKCPLKDGKTIHTGSAWLDENNVLNDYIIKMGIFSKKKKEKPPIPETTKNNVAKVLQLCYEQKIAPFERLHAFEAFHSPPLFAPEFNSKPMVLFLGQQSVGKTTMIKHLMGGQEYPGSYIGLETATDCFTVIHYDETVRTIMGTTLAADSNKPFQCLNQFGSSFLKNLRGASLPVNLLKHVYLIDTPGILSGQKQTISREYDYASVVKFMADKVDMIILMFDATKLEISNECKLILQQLKENEEKIKIVLNKTDYVDQVELSRFWWNLSKIMATPEIPKFFIGSFLISYINAEDDFADLFKELERLPIQHLSQKVNEVTKRTKSVQVHALIMDQLLKKMCWKSEKQRTLVLRDKKLKAVFLDIKQKYNMTDSDLPDYESFKDHAQKSYLKSWNKINPKMLVKLEEFLMKDVTKIYQILRYDEGDAAVLKQEFDVILEQRKQHQNRQNPVSRKTSTQSTITLNSTLSELSTIHV